MMAPPRSVEANRKFFSVDEANKTLPLVRAIVGDIVRQFRTVNELGQFPTGCPPFDKEVYGPIWEAAKKK